MEWLQILGIFILAQVVMPIVNLIIREAVGSQYKYKVWQAVDLIFGSVLAPFWITLGTWLIV